LKVLLIAGARPNFMKIAPIYRESLHYDQVECRIVHTGQHYDYEMSETFFEDLELPEPHFFLNAGSGTHGVQTAKIMVAFEELCQTERPITIEMGSNVLGGTKRDTILKAYEEAVNGSKKACAVPPKWDGKAAERIWRVLISER